MPSALMVSFTVAGLVSVTLLHAGVFCAVHPALPAIITQH